MSNVIALCVGMCGVVLFTYLLTIGTLGATQYTGLIALTGVLSVAIANIHLLEILDLRNMRVEMQRARDDVFAKAEEIQRVAAGVAAFTTDAIISENRFASSSTQDRMLRRRDRLEAFLKDAGVAEERREELLRPILVTADWDSRMRIVVNVVAAWKVPPGTSPTDSSARDQMRNELRTILQKPDRPAALTEATEYLERRGISSDAITESIETYRQRLITGTLPRFGPSDDLSKPPAEMMR